MRKSILLRMIIMIGIYLGLTYLGGDIGRKILYPIRLLVTFLHEFGHAVGALITGGSVLDVQINSDGSGFTRSMGGWPSVILMGGYLGSALFGNLLFLIGARAEKLVKPFSMVLAIAMVLTGIIWFNSVFTTGVLIAFGIFLLFIASKTSFADEVLMFLGLASIIFIIQDFNVGPSSDLSKYAEVMVVLPAQAWMYIWLGIALLLTFLNLRIVFRKDKVKETQPPI